MAFSLSSSLNGSFSKLFLSFPVIQPRKHFTVTCRTRTETVTSTASTDFYKLLSLNHKAGPDEIKQAYRTMALKFHPDMCHDPLMKEESTMVFVELNNAYETLSDPVLRQEYDLRLSFGDLSHNFKRSCSCQRVERRKWEAQVVELRRRSSFRGGKEGSWGSRVRASNHGRI